MEIIVFKNILVSFRRPFILEKIYCLLEGVALYRIHYGIFPFFLTTGTNLKDLQDGPKM